MDTRLVAREKQLESWALIIQECKNSGLKTRTGWIRITFQKTSIIIG